MSQATGLSHNTISKGIEEVQERYTLKEPAVVRPNVRKAGGGR